jgi:Zn-dependent protease
MKNLSDGILWYAVFLLSTVFHEFAHAFTAMKMGDMTAYEKGQVSLNPIPHMKREPWGTIIVPIASFLLGGWMIGWASTPYDRKWAFTHPKKSAAMAAAGPISNFILILLSSVLIHIGINFGYLHAPESLWLSNLVESNNPGFFEVIAKLLSVMFSLNIILFIFNLIPLPPLDGSGMIPMYLSENTGRKYINLVSHPAFSLIGIFIAWKLFDIFFIKIYPVFINILYFGSNYH